MQSLLRNIFSLTLFIYIINSIGYAQAKKPTVDPVMRSIDSIEMLMNGPRNFLSPAINKKAPHSLTSKRAISAFRAMAADKFTGVSGTVCSDTSWRYSLAKEPFYFYAQGNIRCSDGYILVTGTYVNTLDNSVMGGFLMKCNDKGVAQWTRLYNTTIQGQPFTYCYYYKVLELKDGTFLLAGKSLNPANGHYDLMLTHTDRLGNVIWNKTYASKLWIMDGSGSADFFYVADMQEDITGDIFFTGPHWENGLNVTRMKISDGGILWSNYYGDVTYNFNVPFGMDLGTSDLQVFSKWTGGLIQRSRIDKMTGNAAAYNYLAVTDPAKTYLGFINGLQMVKTDNGHYLLGGNLYRYYISTYDPDQSSPLAHAGIVEVDADFNFVKAWYFSNSTEAFSPATNTRVTLRKDGTGVFSMFGNYTSAQVYVQFRDQQLLHQRNVSYQNESINMENTAIASADSGDLIIKHVMNWTTLKGKLEFLNLHLQDTSSDCLGMKDNSNYIFPYQLQPVAGYTAGGVPNDFTQSLTQTVTVTDINLDYTPVCTQIRVCDTLSLVKNIDTVCLNTPFNFTVRKNPACTDSVSFDYNASQIQSYARMNDSLFSITFKNTGTATIYGTISGCAILKDSIKVVVVASATGKIDLGPDTAICPGNTIVLHTRPRLSAYTWQDGSTDSVFIVKQPGLYYVRVVDNCGNILRDTVTVISRAALPFDAVTDTSICEKDSIQLKAPAGFISYHWSPDYRISSLTAPTVYVFPLSDTMYHIKAEVTPGCFAEDSLHIIVKHGASINLGTDKSFCSGDSLLLNAGAGFSNYTWSNGKSGQFTTVYNPGYYSVIAINQNGCKSADTMRVLNVFAKPQPDLGTDSVICEGSVRIISPGIFDQYKWNTGSTASSISVTTTGLYSVVVTDNNHCTGRDSIVLHTSGCLPGFYIPTAFTPGHDGKNDFFRPLIFGNLIQYEFTVFNRFGQVVFSSKQAGKGWDGANAPSNNAFAWTCKYQLENEPVKFEKGMVLLLR